MNNTKLSRHAAGGLTWSSLREAIVAVGPVGETKPKTTSPLGTHTPIIREVALVPVCSWYFLPSRTKYLLSSASCARLGVLIIFLHRDSKCQNGTSPGGAITHFRNQLGHVSCRSSCSGLLPY